MSSPTEVHAATEGLVDAAVAQRLIKHAGGDVGLIRPAGGKSKLDLKIPKYNNASTHQRWLVIRDLDRDAPCCGDLRRVLLVGQQARFFCLRIVVRAIESWLLSDRQAIANFLKINVALIPADLEKIADPKLAVVNLARRSRSASVRASFVPHPRAGRIEGPEYASEMERFARDHSNVEAALADGGCRSLERAVHRIRELVISKVA